MATLQQTTALNDKEPMNSAAAAAFAMKRKKKEKADIASLTTAMKNAMQALQDRVQKDKQRFKQLEAVDLLTFLLLQLAAVACAFMAAFFSVAIPSAAPPCAITAGVVGLISLATNRVLKQQTEKQKELITVGAEYSREAFGAYLRANRSGNLCIDEVKRFDLLISEYSTRTGSKIFSLKPLYQYGELATVEAPHSTIGVVNSLPSTLVGPRAAHANKLPQSLSYYSHLENEDGVVSPPENKEGRQMMGPNGNLRGSEPGLHPKQATDAHTLPFGWKLW